MRMLTTNELVHECMITAYIRAFLQYTTVTMMCCRLVEKCLIQARVEPFILDNEVYGRGKSFAKVK